MYLCYLDESGTSEAGNTSHYVLAGISIPIEYWKSCDERIEKIKAKYGLAGEEIHVAWLLRSYREQNQIANFEKLDYDQRRQKVVSLRAAELLRTQHLRNSNLYKQTKKNYRDTEKYIHLTLAERQRLVTDIASEVSGWGFARLFAECIDKIHFAGHRQIQTPEAQAFEQVISRFERYMQITNKGVSHQRYGMLIHDNNETVAKKLTLLMKKFHKDGTLWTKVSCLIETPLFVNSELTAMVQIADLCSYSLRRYLENKETALFDLIFKRADRKEVAVGSSIIVGIRHFTKQPCSCKICSAHRPPILLEDKKSSP
jgi:hypothetical protein